jgi:hypothetical protein
MTTRMALLLRPRGAGDLHPEGLMLKAQVKDEGQVNLKLTSDPQLDHARSRHPRHSLTPDVEGPSTLHRISIRGSL